MSGNTMGSNTMTGISGAVTNKLLSEDGGNTSGGTVELSFLGFDSVDRLPIVVFSGVYSLDLELVLQETPPVNTMT
ncbi:hypothetical protein, partial [Klebsiella pneumoniae]|uniref:hypothetical protein n=1 Tax=Klebsiella pneumoniae TaxID=573 RepID=UPI00132FB54E